MCTLFYFTYFILAFTPPPPPRTLFYQFQWHYIWFEACLKMYTVYFGLEGQGSMLT